MEYMMKRLFTIIAVVLMSVTAAQAQRFGVIGGFTSSYTGIDGKNAIANLKNVSLWHAGVAYNHEIGPFFAIQPQLMYQMKGANAYQTITEGTYKDAINSFQSQTGFLELSVGLHAGIDVLVARPYFLFEPFVGYAVYKGKDTFSQVGEKVADGSITNADVNAALNSVKNGLEFGFGVGGGITFLGHFQVSVQWFMNLGNLYDGGKIDGTDIADNLKTYYKDFKNYHGIKVTAALFF